MPTRSQEISPGGGVQAQYFPGVSNSFQGGGGVQLLFYKETCGFSRVGGPGVVWTSSPHSGPAHDLYTCVSV